MKRALALAVAACALACTRPRPRTHAGDDDDAATQKELRALEADEAKLRASTDWATFPASDTTLGPDPIDVVALPGGGFAGVLRGANALVLLDDDGREVARAEAPRAPRQIALDGERLLVAGELSNVVAVYTVSTPHPPPLPGGALRRGRDVVVAGVDGLRGVCAGPGGTLDVVDTDGVLHALDARGREIGRVDVGPGALFVKRAGSWLVSMSVLGHRIVAVPVDEHGALDALHAVHVDNDGPFWGFDARVVDGHLEIAAGHVEDHPLDRSGGSFGYIDSFLRVVAVDASPARPRTLLELDTSALGVVTPKAVAFLDDHTVLALGAGSGRGVRVDVATGKSEPVRALPGVAAVAFGKHVLGADPLLDAFVVDDRAVPVAAAPGAPPRSVASKLGEAVAFTTIMAPRQKSDGPLSRFTCEACHFEGGVDGRVHDTSRADDKGRHILATTKPLRGLFNNKPLFSRALDEDLSQMVHAEFRVANAKSGLDPWFALTPADAPWLSLLGVTGTQEPIDLRRALVAFFHDFTPRTNPRSAGKRAFTDEERRGAAVFRDRCASCHAPRLVGDDSKTVQSFDTWERFVLSDNDPLTWSSEGRKKTGIEPYVHPDGPRPSSLRRIADKTPYFTNGAAKTLSEVAAMARFDETTFLHSSKRTDLTALTPDDQRALVTFLRLL